MTPILDQLETGLGRDVVAVSRLARTEAGGVGRGAWFSPESPMERFAPVERGGSRSRYRYLLWRWWGSDLPPAVFILLNHPSTADAEVDDPTVTRCARRAQVWGFPGLLVVNLFSWRASDPDDLAFSDDPTGPRNDEALRFALDLAGLTVCGWGASGGWRARDRAVEVRRLLAGRAWHHLGLTAGGEPRHPLYLSYDAPLTAAE